jgi:hypothetical protein
MPKLVSLVLIAIVVAALAMFGMGLADSLHACSQKHWIGCDWNHVQSLGVWLIPVGVVLLIGIARLFTRKK